MPFFDRLTPAGEFETVAGAPRAAASRAAGLKAAAPSTVFVELGEAAQKAQIARDGVGVPQVKINADVLQGVLAGRPEFVTKVVSQSIAPGTPVPRGTSIDIVLAQPFFLPVNVFSDVHTGLASQSVGAVFENFVRNNAALRNVIARNDSADSLTDADRGVVQAAFASQNVPITENPGETLAQGFNTLQAAFAFGTA